jgi:hypothetical protein
VIGRWEEEDWERVRFCRASSVLAEDDEVDGRAEAVARGLISYLLTSRRGIDMGVAYRSAATSLLAC